MNVKISVITASYNSAGYIKRAIESVLSQTYPNVEYLVMDGGSTDGTLEILKGYGNQIRWYSEPDKGIYDALSKGFAKATGDVLTWLDSDNFYCGPEVLTKVAEAFAGNPGLDLVLANGYTWHPELDEKTAVKPVLPDFSGLLNQGNRFMPEEIFYTRDLYFKSGGLDLRYRLLADYELWLKMFRLKPKALKLDLYSATYTVRFNALLRKSPARAWQETFIIGKMYKRAWPVRLEFRLKYVWAMLRFYAGLPVKNTPWLLNLYKRYHKIIKRFKD